MGETEVIEKAGLEGDSPLANKEAPEDRPGSARSDGGASAKERRLHPLVELTLSRIREFVREPEVIFWVFAFPILLVCALGIAFRNTGPEKIRIGVETTDSAGASSTTLMESLSRSPDVEPLLLSPAEATQALRSGKVALVVRPSSATSGATNQPANPT